MENGTDLKFDMQLNIEDVPNMCYVKIFVNYVSGHQGVKKSKISNLQRKINFSDLLHFLIKQLIELNYCGLPHK